MRNAIGLILLGAAAGVALNMMMSSSRKKSLRSKLYKNTEDFMDAVKDRIHAGNQRISEYAELAEDRIDMLNRKIKAMEKAGA